MWRDMGKSDLSTQTVNAINGPRIDAEESDRSPMKLELAANWNYPPFLRWVLPAAVRDALRELRARMLAYLAFRHLPGHKEFEQSSEDASASAYLSIIVPVHDAPEVTRRCLMSLQKFAPKAEVILVDDASKLEDTGRILDDFSSRNSWRLIRHADPLGHSGACGAGGTVATRPYLCLLNSDTVVTPWCWRPIVEVFENNPNIGAAGPSTSYSGNPQTLPLAFSTRFHLSDSQICEYAGRLFAEYQGNNLINLLWVSGFAFFIRRALWEQLGGFDRNLPDYCNDVELCKRLTELGYGVAYVRNSYIHHLAGASYSVRFGRESLPARVRVAESYIEEKFSRR